MGQARDEARADRVGDKREHDRDGLRLSGKRGSYRRRSCQQHVGLQTDELTSDVDLLRTFGSTCVGASVECR